MAGCANSDNGPSGCDVTTNGVELRLRWRAPPNTDQQHIRVFEFLDFIKAMRGVVHGAAHDHDIESILKKTGAEGGQSDVSVVRLCRDQHYQLLLRDARFRGEGGRFQAGKTNDQRKGEQ